MGMSNTRTRYLYVIIEYEDRYKQGLMENTKLAPYISEKCHIFPFHLINLL